MYNFTDKVTLSVLEKQDDDTFQVSNLPFPLPFCDKGLATQIFVSDQLTFTFWKCSIGTLEKRVKYVQGKQ